MLGGRWLQESAHPWCELERRTHHQEGPGYEEGESAANLFACESVKSSHASSRYSALPYSEVATPHTTVLLIAYGVRPTAARGVVEGPYEARRFLGMQP